MASRPTTKTSASSSGISRHALICLVATIVPAHAGSWSTLTSLPTGRKAPFVAPSGDSTTIYVFGGADSSPSVVGTGESYSIADASWSTVASSMPTPRCCGGAATIDSELYFVGGYKAGALATVELYTPATGIWQGLAPLPAGRYEFGLATYGDKLVVSGGRDAEDVSEYSQTVWCYHVSENSWSALPEMPSSRWGHASATIGSVLYISHGATTAVADSDSLWAYDFEREDWTTLAPAPTARSGVAYAASSSALYVVGHDAVTEYEICEAYNVHLSVWSSLPSNSDLPDLGSSTATMVASTLYVMGACGRRVALGMHIHDLTFAFALLTGGDANPDPSNSVLSYGLVDTVATWAALSSAIGTSAGDDTYTINDGAVIEIDADIVFESEIPILSGAVVIRGMEGTKMISVKDSENRHFNVAGALRLSGLTFTNGSGGLGVGGGSIIAKGGTVSINECTYERNECVGGKGGAIAITSSGIVVATLTAFMFNYAGAAGGAVNVGSNDTDDSSFTSKANYYFNNTLADWSYNDISISSGTLVNGDCEDIG